MNWMIVLKKIAVAVLQAVAAVVIAPHTGIPPEVAVPAIIGAARGAANIWKHRK